MGDENTSNPTNVKPTILPGRHERANVNPLPQYEKPPVPTSPPPPPKKKDEQ